jgi:hypothetical protein
MTKGVYTAKPADLPLSLALRMVNAKVGVIL